MKGTDNHSKAPERVRKVGKTPSKRWGLAAGKKSVVDAGEGEDLELGVCAGDGRRPLSERKGAGRVGGLGQLRGGVWSH